MALPARQQRTLDGIEDALQAREPRMMSMFAILTWLTRDDWPAKPEQLTGSRPGRSARLRAFVLIPVMFAMPITGAVLGGTARGSATCGARLAGYEPARSASTGRAM